MKTRAIKTVGLVSLFIFAATIASAAGNVSRSSMRITLNVPEQVKLVNASTFQSTSNTATNQTELVSTACFSSTSRQGAYQVTATHNGSADYQVSMNNQNSGFVNVSGQSSMQVSSQQTSCGTTGNTQIKLTNNTQSSNAKQPNVVNFKIIPV